MDDSEPFRNFICSRLSETAGWQIIGEVSDGLEAVRKAEELQPELIVLDIALPCLNGIEAARRIRKVSPKSRILFLSQESSADVVEEALGTGASGYVVKSDAGKELTEALDTVLRGDQFVGKRFSDIDFTRVSDDGGFERLQTNIAPEPLQRESGIDRHHDGMSYSQD